MNVTVNLKQIKTRKKQQKSKTIKHKLYKMKTKIINKASKWDNINRSEMLAELNAIQNKLVSLYRHNGEEAANQLQQTILYRKSTQIAAVMRVTSAKGARTPGIDGQLIKTSEDK
jgi:retron-type reverse transcriptase